VGLLAAAMEVTRKILGLQDLMRVKGHRSSLGGRLKADLLLKKDKRKFHHINRLNKKKHDFINRCRKDLW
jgi:hypothetical protein